MALGDAHVRLREADGEGAAAYVAVVREATARHPMFVQGALRALAMLRLVPDAAGIEAILAHGPSLPAGDRMGEGGRAWIAAAAAGWGRPEVRAFLEAVRGDDPRTARAAEASLEERHLKWSVL